jgi:hypothetical protein
MTSGAGRTVGPMTTIVTVARSAVNLYAIASAALSVLVAAQTAAGTDRDTNLKTCLTGKYPALCNHDLLSGDQLNRVREAERGENLKTCLTGQYPALCDYSRLTKEELARVREAEKRENLKICLTGQYPVLCKRDLLSKEDVAKVSAAERVQNRKICLDGRYPVLCNRSLLSPEEAQKATEAERRAAAASPSGAGHVSPRQRYRGSGSCESGHWIEWVSDDGEMIKLEDGSIWEVNPLDAIDSALWLPVTEILVCDHKLINVDDGESV